MDELIFRSTRGIESMQVQSEIVASRTKEVFIAFSRQCRALFSQLWHSSSIQNLKGNILQFIQFVVDVSKDIKELIGEVLREVNLKYISMLLAQSFGGTWTRKEITVACVGFLMGGLVGIAVGLALKKREPVYRYMQAVQVVHYLGPEAATVVEDALSPYECGDYDVLINVKAASVQVIDAQICCGYGRNFRKILRKLYNESDLPVTLGRDCTGIITDLGKKVKRLEIGDEVWVTLPYWSPGTLCQTILVSENRVAHKPKNIGFEGACSIPYAGSIALSTLSQVSVDSNNAHHKRILIEGGCTPVGCVLIQLLRSWKAHVTASCYKRAVPVAQALGANEVICLDDLETETKTDNNVNSKNLLKQLEAKNEQYDIIILTKNERLNLGDLNKFCVSGGHVLSTYPQKLSSDSFGYFASILFSAYIYLKNWCGELSDEFDEAHLCYVTLDKLMDLVEDGALQTVVDKVFHPKDIELALHHIQSSQSIGSTVITFR